MSGPLVGGKMKVSKNADNFSDFVGHNKIIA